jgi:hypothetical protein
VCIPSPAFRIGSFVPTIRRCVAFVDVAERNLTESSFTDIMNVNFVTADEQNLVRSAEVRTYYDISRYERLHLESKFQAWQSPLNACFKNKANSYLENKP